VITYFNHDMLRSYSWNSSDCFLILQFCVIKQTSEHDPKKLQTFWIRSCEKIKQLETVCAET